MTAENGKETFRLGFLTAIEVPERGFVGGLLVTNHFGRPLEFQCTAPLKPNRTQEILYGPTLVPYVLGDLIGKTLIDKIGIKPHILLTEREDLLPLRNLVSIPIACVDDLPAMTCTKPQAEAEPAVTASPDLAESSNPASELQPIGEPIAAEPVAVVSTAFVADALANRSQSTEIPATQVAGSAHFRLGRQLLRFHAAHEEDQSVAEHGAAVVPNDADLREPFERVREALNETARPGGVR